MQELHMRLSVAIKVTDEEFNEIVDRQLREFGAFPIFAELEYEDLPKSVQMKLETDSFERSDWDNGGYVPGAWLKADVISSGLYDVTDYGIRRKEN